MNRESIKDESRKYKGCIEKVLRMYRESIRMNRESIKDVSKKY